MPATPSDIPGGLPGTGMDAGDPGGSWYLPDMDLVNDLGTAEAGTSAGPQDVSLADIHHDMVLCNQLLGVVIALLLFQYALGLLNFFIRLVTKNITNYM